MYQKLSYTDNRMVVAAAALAIAAALVVLYRYNPIGSSIYPQCPLYATTGIYCPGCGSLRAIHQLAHGELLAALSFNPLMIISLPFLIYAFVSRAWQSFRGRSLPGVFLSRSWIMAIFWLIMAYWVLRNVPAYPFNLLAP